MITGKVARHLDDLPDEPRLGIYLMGIGAAIIGIRFAWARFSGFSLQKANAAFAGYVSQYSLPDTLFYAGLICVVAGAFIFFRRGVWRLQERRDEKSITHLQFK
jgi:hypothetical protein